MRSLVADVVPDVDQCDRRQGGSLEWVLGTTALAIYQAVRARVSSRVAWNIVRGRTVKMVRHLSERLTGDRVFGETTDHEA